MEISQLSLKRLFNRAGIRRVSATSYNQLYKLVENVSQNILDKASTLVKSRQNQVISQEEIRNGFILTKLLNIINQQVQDGGGDGTDQHEAGWCDNNPSQCGQTGGVGYCDGQLSQCGNFSEEALTSCQFNQSGSGDYYFTIPSTQFHRFANSLISREFQDIKLTKSGLKELQYLLENKLVEHLSKLNSVNNQKVFQL